MGYRAPDMGYGVWGMGRGGGGGVGSPVATLDRAQGPLRKSSAGMDDIIARPLLIIKALWGMGYRVWGMVRWGMVRWGMVRWGIGYGLWGVGYGVWGMGCRVWGIGYGVSGMGYGVSGMGCRV